MSASSENDNLVTLGMNTELFPAAVVERAREMLTTVNPGVHVTETSLLCSISCSEFSRACACILFIVRTLLRCQAYSESQGIRSIRQEVADFIAKRDGHPSSAEYAGGGMTICIA